MHKKIPGLFVAFEGIDGCGKTTQVHQLYDYLKERGLGVFKTAEPTQRDIGRLIRNSLSGQNTLGEAAVALLFAADRLEHLEHDVEPELNMGHVVLCDRYVLSSLAYQSMHVPLNWVSTLNERARWPDATLFFRIDPDVAATRRQARNSHVSRYETTDLQKRIAEGFEGALSLYNQHSPCFVIDANQTQEAVFQQVRTIVDDLLKQRGH